MVAAPTVTRGGAWPPAGTKCGASWAGDAGAARGFPGCGASARAGERGSGVAGSQRAPRASVSLPFPRGRRQGDDRECGVRVSFSREPLRAGIPLRAGSPGAVGRGAAGKSKKPKKTSNLGKILFKK